MAKNRLVIKYLIIDENDNVVDEYQHKILDPQEHHPHHCNTGGGGSEIQTIVVEKSLTINLEIDDTKDYTGYDRMYRLTEVDSTGFDGQPSIFNDGGWVKSGTHKQDISTLEVGKTYAISLATPNNPLMLFNNQGAFEQVATILEDGVDKTEEWTKDYVGNFQLTAYRKTFIYNGSSLPTITFKIELV